ncbi:unnamed protein product [Adineta steineri]|uniref:EF-hand domain-containing protein n=1 Tax=Adineta steineri TaxID=433720 RepID=A0A818KFS5_9BILA|nr:unnamed protein product [Adineta steineri]CAF3554533.1 unnamed protein product [Adineta steineri]
MGARQSRNGHDQWDLNQLQQVSGLSPQQIQQLQQEFFQAAGRDGVIDRNEFPNVYARFAGGQNVSQQQIARVFQTFDRDQSGSLSFDEFLSAAVMMNRNVPRQNRLDYVIRQNNHHGRQQGDGRISAQYGHQVFRRLNDYYGLPQGTEHQCWKQVDQQNRGYVSQNEFMNYISQQDVYNRRYQ